MLDWWRDPLSAVEGVLELCEDTECDLSNEFDEVDLDVGELKVSNVDVWVLSGKVDRNVAELWGSVAAWFEVLLGKLNSELTAGLYPFSICVKLPLNKIPGCLRPLITLELNPDPLVRPAGAEPLPTAEACVCSETVSLTTGTEGLVCDVLGLS